MKKIFPFLMALLLIASCGKDDDGGDGNVQLDRDKFLGSYDIEYTCFINTPVGPEYTDDTKIFFVELPDASLGLSDNIVVFNGLFYNTTFNFTINGNDFIVVTQNETPVAQGYFENGNLVFTQFRYGGYSGCTTPITATRRN
jgi:hypothetical protein